MRSITGALLTVAAMLGMRAGPQPVFDHDRVTRKSSQRTDHRKVLAEMKRPLPPRSVDGVRDRKAAKARNAAKRARRA